MLVVLAAAGDAAATALVERWRFAGASLLTARDLSTAGWRVWPGAPADGVAVVDGARVAVREIGAVLTRVPAVTARDVPWILRADRAYVAQEMTAFLLAWLSELECPVVNRPSPTGLWGPHLAPERWVRLAVDAGLRVAPPHRGGVTVTVAGERCIGDVTEDLCAGALTVARTAGVEMLAVRFDGRGPGAAFLGADYRLAVTDGAVADALLDLLAGVPM